MRAHANSSSGSSSGGGSSGATIADTRILAAERLTTSSYTHTSDNNNIAANGNIQRAFWLRARKRQPVRGATAATKRTTQSSDKRLRRPTRRRRHSNVVGARTEFAFRRICLASSSLAEPSQASFRHIDIGKKRGDEAASCKQRRRRRRRRRRSIASHLSEWRTLAHTRT